MWKIDDADGRLRTMMLESAQWGGAHIWRRAHECEDGIGILIVHPSNHGAGQLMSIFSPHGADADPQRRRGRLEPRARLAR